jgi:hypothetical protein
MTPAPAGRDERRHTAQVLLDRISNGYALTPDEAALLRAAWAAECDIADQLADRLNNTARGLRRAP